MSEFINYLHEIFQSFGEIKTRKMFGGFGIYHQDLMFGLVADDELYLKVDAQSIDEFEECDLQPFEYMKNGKAMKMSYYRAPEAIFDDPDQASIWAARAYAAALRAKKPQFKHRSVQARL